MTIDVVQVIPFGVESETSMPGGTLLMRRTPSAMSGPLLVTVLLKKTRPLINLPTTLLTEISA
jgi:hypothetical protein